MKQPTGTRLSMKITEWPALDQKRWNQGLQPCGPFGPASPAANWSAARVRIVSDGYGQWLSWLESRGFLDPKQSPGARVTETLVQSYIEQLRSRVAPVSVAMMIQSLQRALTVLEPRSNWAWLRRAASALKAAAKPSRNKREKVVPSRELYELGMRLAVTAETNAAHPLVNATQFRDGLMISLLAARPIRIRNLAQIEVGRHLLLRNGIYWLCFTKAETKTNRPIEVYVLESLALPLEIYLEVHRPVLLGRMKGRGGRNSRALWISKRKTPMGEAAIRLQIKLRTEATFGHKVNPHLFRDCAATSIAIEDPVHVRIATEILGHRKISTTERHYNQARGLEAGRVYQAAIQELRRRHDGPEAE